MTQRLFAYAALNTVICGPTVVSNYTPVRQLIMRQNREDAS